MATPDPTRVFLRAGATVDEGDPSIAVDDSNPQANVFLPGDGTQFKVRRGPDYPRNGKKEHSLEQMYDVVAMDCFRAEKRVYPISRIVNLPPLAPHAQGWFHPYVPATLVVNMQLPNCPAKLFGTSDLNGPTLHLVFYYQIRADTVAALSGGAGSGETAGHRLWAEWCDRAFREEKFRGRFKMIGVIDNFRALGLPTLLAGYNGKPAIIFRTGSAVRGEGNSYMELGVNVHMFPVLTRRTLWGLKSKCRLALAHIGGTIEARSNEEMPERIVFCARLHRPLAFDAPLLTLPALEWLNQAAERLHHNHVVEKVGADFPRS